MADNITYDECVSYIMNIPKFQGEPSLTKLYALLMDITGHANISQVIHVAGTNGKGSVCMYISRILKKAGYSVGLFTSPHLVDMRERIALNNEYITKEKFVEHFHIVKNAYEKSDKEFLTFFEWTFLIAMSFYSKMSPDYIILETGLGGRLDATNCLDKKDLTVITEIGLDHMQILGDSFKKIAAEKAGIIKAGVPLVYWDKRKEASAIIEDIFNSINPSGYIHAVSRNNVANIKSYGKGLSFDYVSSNCFVESVALDTKAIYQCENAALSIAAIKALDDIAISEDDIRAGLTEAFWPGRMEEIKPGIIIDGAHNEDGIDAMLESAAAITTRKILLFAVVNDKNYRDMVRKICDKDIFDEIIITTISSAGSRNTDASDILNEFKFAGLKEPITAIDDLNEAYCYCTSIMKNDTLIISGSLYLVGEIKALLK